MRKQSGLVASAAVTVGGAVALLASPAAAHVTPDKDEVPNESYETVTLSVGHGCEESPTTELTVHIPENLSNISPMVKPGWDIEVVEEELDEPREGPHGDEITEQVTEVVYTAEEGNELPDGFRDTFTLGFRTTFTEPGDYLFFKTVQTCEEGANEWTAEYVEGVTEGEEPEEPSPVLLVTEAEAEEAEEASEGGDPVEAEPAGATDGEEASGGESSSSSDETGLAVAGILVGLLGLAVGGTALFRARPRSS